MCDDAVSAIACDQHYIGFKSDTPSKSLTCHETGHAVGLTHGLNAFPSFSQIDYQLGSMKTPVNGEALGLMNVLTIHNTY